jgi:hypothetical protein
MPFIEPGKYDVNAEINQRLEIMKFEKFAMWDYIYNSICGLILLGIIAYVAYRFCEYFRKDQMLEEQKYKDRYR